LNAQPRFPRCGRAGNHNEASHGAVLATNAPNSRGWLVCREDLK
jgi:hypothetical protein